MKLALLALLACTPLVANAESWRADLDRDGQLEHIRLVPRDKVGGAYDLMVTDAAGKRLWTSQRPISDAGEFIAGVGDVDGDGQVDLVYGCSSRGGPPMNFAFVPARGRGFPGLASCKAQPFWLQPSGAYRLAPPRGLAGRYAEIDKILRPGHLLVRLEELDSGGARRVLDGGTFQGQAELMRQPDGDFRLARWTQPWHRFATVNKRLVETALYRALRDDDLQGLSPRQLTLARNEIFAAHGRPFRDPQLSAHFRSRPWYRPDPAYSDARVPALETRNAQFIADYQRRHGSNW